MNSKMVNQVLNSVHEVSNRDGIESGKVIERYNISNARIEYYFIPAENIEAFEKAKSRQETDAHDKYGVQI